MILVGLVHVALSSYLWRNIWVVRGQENVKDEESVCVRSVGGRKDQSPAIAQNQNNLKSLAVQL